LKSFNYDDYLSKYIRSSAPLTPLRPERHGRNEDYVKRIVFTEECSRILHTPYQHSFASRLNGLPQPPLSKIKPSYIRREYGVYPLGLQFLQEIAIVSRNKADAKSGSQSLVRAASPIDFLNLSQAHVEQCNGLLQRLFWPGITISDCIGYKTGIVAVYRKLVVGLGVITPDGYLMYLAVRPHWEGNGIGRMMLWWLAKENENVDITLHVAADNPALVFLFRMKLIEDYVSIVWIQSRGVYR
jgi:GNAT superfamily N-acetyltransferase